MRFAYVLLLYKNPGLFNRLFRAIYNEQDFFALHVDRKAPTAIHQAAFALAESRRNVRIVPARRITWGGWSLTAATLDGFSSLVEMGEWDFVFNLSGQDYPLRSRQSMVEYLQGRRSQNFIETFPVPSDESVRLNRLVYFHIETRRRVYRLPIRRHLPGNPFWGSFWITANRDFASYVACDTSLSRLKKYFRHTLLGDEYFFQMTAMNSAFRSSVVSDNLRYIAWDCDDQGRAPEHPRTLTSIDLPKMLAVNNAFFARKFDDAVDAAVLDELDQRRQ